MAEPVPASWLALPGARTGAAKLALWGTLSALTEGLGLVLLVPMLGALAGNGLAAGQAGRVPELLAAAGLPIALGPLLALFVMLAVLRGLLLLLRNRAALALELTVVDGLRRRVWRALLHCDWRTLSGMKRADTASLMISNLERVGVGINQVLGAATTALTLGALGLAALAIAPAVALGGALGGIAVLAAFAGLRRRSARLGMAMGEAWNRIHGGIGEGLGALRMIKSLGAEARAEAVALDGFDDLASARRRYVSASGLGQIALQGGGAAALALLVWLAFARWNMPLATVLPVVALFARALPLLGTLQETWQHWLHARPALHETLALVAAVEAAREPDCGDAPPPALTQAICLDGVTVHYAGPAVPALAAIDLVIPAGKITALEGPSGSGKSTLADLVGGLLAPDQGTVSIDGQRLDPPLRRAWRTRVAYVQQDPVLIAGTVRENLEWGGPAAGTAALDAALADASSRYVHDLPQGLNTPLGDGGRLLSGGERQRLMLARALLRDPALLILDEATSALDRANEDAIAEALERLRGRMTILLIAHRGRLLELADRVVSLERGRLAAILERK